MTAPIRVLLLEDQPLDAELILRELRGAGLEVEAHRVEDEAGFIAALDAWKPDIVLTDFSLPTFDGLSAIRLAHVQAPTTPIIVVTGSISEEVAVECIKAGAADYVIKDRPGRLGLAVRAALDHRALAESRRKADEVNRQLSLAVEQNPASVIVTDTEGRIEYVNSRFTEVTGYTLDEVLGRNPNLLRAGHTPRSGYEHLWTTILSGRRWQGDFLNVRKNGEYFWEQASISPIRNPAGVITHFVAVKEDVTERRQRERELALIAAVGSAADDAPSVPEFFDRVLRFVQSALDADGAAVIGQGPPSDTVEVLAAGGAWQSATGALVSVEVEPLRGVLRSGEPYHGLPGALGPCLMPEGTPLGWDLIGVPLAAQGEPIGTLWVGRNLERAEAAFLPWDLAVLRSARSVLGSEIYRQRLSDQTDRRLARLVAMQEIDQAIAASLDPRVTLNVVLDNVMAQLDVDAGDVLLLNPHLRVLQFAAGRGLPRVGRSPAPVSLGLGIAGLAALERRVVNDRDPALREDGASQDGDPPPGFAAQHTVPLITKGQVIGVLSVYHRRVVTLDAEWHDFLLAVAEQAAIGIENARLFQDLQRSNDELAMAYDATIEGWVRALDLRDQETEGHTQRVTELTLTLARAMGVEEAELIHIRRGALLHDIGKMGVPDAILRKPGPLTEAERAEMQMHTAWAYEWLSPIRYLRPAMDIPYCHHERWDGTGYPRGLVGEQIPLSARMFAVVDIYDAMRSTRIYRAAWSEERVIAHLRELAGTHLDRHLVDVFLAMVAPDAPDAV